MQRTFDESKALAAMKEIAEVPVELEIKAGELLMLISTIQLAWRHPGWAGPTRDVVEGVARNWQDLVALRGSDMWLALEAGWDRAQDVPQDRGAQWAPRSEARGQRGPEGTPVSEPVSQSDSQTEVSGQRSAARGGRWQEMGRGSHKEIRGLTRAVVAVVNRWIAQQNGASFIDVFMGMHNAHCAVIFDLEKRSGDYGGHLRKMALDTMKKRFDVEGVDHISPVGREDGV